MGIPFELKPRFRTNTLLLVWNFYNLHEIASKRKILLN